MAKTGERVARVTGRDDGTGPAAAKSKEPRKINLALQGGGAHGAYAWGVLDKLLEDGRFEIDGLCGTSAGAMNAVVYAYGKMMDGPENARRALHDFWQDISRTGQMFSPVRSNPFEQMLGLKTLQDASFLAFESLTRLWSPYHLNPFNFNPLRDVLERHVDFDEIHGCYCTNIFVCATNVRTGKPRIFNNAEISADTVLASACLPFLFQAVEVGGEHYWDGGYVGNPALYPMIYETKTDDILVLHVNPIERDELPVNASDIMNRINEVSFNSSLVREMRAIAFVQKMLRDGWIKDEYRSKVRDIRMHAIRADKEMCELSVASKFSADWDFLLRLRDMGRASAAAWLAENADKVGRESTVDIGREYL